jgi:hypothetical protein
MSGRPVPVLNFARTWGTLSSRFTEGRNGTLTLQPT